MTNDSYIGRVFEGKYEVIRVLGTGGMGEVYEVKHQLINRRLAIKLLHPEYAKNEEVVRRFQIEAMAAAAVNHNHIIEITDMGITDTEELFIVMELLDGVDLDAALQQQSPMSPKRACHIMVQVLSALEAAHDKQIVHRDLKPANIFLTTRSGVTDYVKLVDFGISKIRESELDLTTGLTQTGVLIGTPVYMSPEQARGETDIDSSTDIYAAGVILYEALTGQLPINDNQMSSLLVKILNEMPADPRSIVPEIPPVLGEAVLKAIEKSPEHRFRNAAEFRRVLTEFSPDTPMLTGLKSTVFSKRVADFSSDSTSVERPHKAPQETIDRDLETVTDSAMARPAKPKWRWPVTAVSITAVLTLLAIGWVFVWRGGDTQEQSADADLIVKPLSESAVVKSDSASPAVEEPSLTMPRMVEFKLQVTPDTAVVSLDGASLGSGPIAIEVPQDDKSHELVVSAQDHRTHHQTLVFKEQVSLVIDLEPSADGQERVRVTSGRKSSPTRAKKGKRRAKSSKKTRAIDEDAPW